jgi:hypothetical protein
VVNYNLPEDPGIIAPYRPPRRAGAGPQSACQRMTRFWTWRHCWSKLECRCQNCWLVLLFHSKSPTTAAGTTKKLTSSMPVHNATRPPSPCCLADVNRGCLADKTQLVVVRIIHELNVSSCPSNSLACSAYPGMKEQQRENRHRYVTAAEHLRESSWAPQRAPNPSSAATARNQLLSLLSQ